MPEEPREKETSLTSFKAFQSRQEEGEAEARGQAHNGHGSTEAMLGPAPGVIPLRAASSEQSHSPSAPGFHTW